jgi:spore coat protein CotH
MYYYEQSDGNGDWTDFIDWLHYFNTTHNDAFAASVTDYIDVNILLRMMAVESFMLGSDNMARGANFFTYHAQDTTDSKKWILFDADFDECFAYDPTTMQPNKANPDIMVFFVPNTTNFDKINPVVTQVLAIPKYYQQYLNDYKTFANAVFGSASKQQPTNRYAEMLEFILPWVTRDRLWQMSFGIDVKEFILDAERTIANLPRRYDDVLTQIEKYTNYPFPIPPIGT